MPVTACSCGENARFGTIRVRKLALLDTKLADLRAQMREIDPWCTDNNKRDARGWVDTYKEEGATRDMRKLF